MDDLKTMASPQILEEAPSIMLPLTLDPTSAEEGATAPRVFYVLVSKLDSSSPPVLFFPYPPAVQLERACPPGYEGELVLDYFSLSHIMH